VTDYFTDLEDQLGRATAAGVHHRHRLTNHLRQVNAPVLAAGVLAVVVAVVLAVLLGARGGGSVSADHSRAPPRPVDRWAAARPEPLEVVADTASIPTLARERRACRRLGHHRQAKAGSSHRFSSRPGAPIRLVAQLYLPAPSDARLPTAVGRVVEQRGALGLSILGLGLPANTKHNAYALWLTNGPGDSKLLGFVNPAVKTDGTLRTAGLLPTHAFHYHEILITLETRPAPSAPGPTVLKGPLHR
jgi:hypothetical protein